ncbi:hypothetical protein FYW06_27780 [Bacillus paranthracis]|uniref:Uncharacterized protein n=1 Tax=Bacillus paranthracis TaxID=2026186 RepID=A0A5M9GG81_9BACI|nr:hypothetical protein FYW06_27780 [Bacillus paranthracis]QPA42216.1 hypothetical protein INR14_29435 [Bacillus paranthracis]
MENTLLKKYSEVVVENHKYIDNLIRCSLSNVKNGMQAFLNGYFTNDVLKDLMNYLQKECPEIEVIDSFIAFSPTFKSHDIAIRIFLKKEIYTEWENAECIAVNAEFNKINDYVCSKIPIFLSKKI